MKSTTGDYVYVPNNAGIQSLKADASDNFAVTASDGIATVSQPFDVTLHGADDPTTLAAPTAPTYTDTAANDTFANSTGTLAGTDRDDPVTYGITGGNTGGTDNINGTVYDVSKASSFGTLFVKSATGDYVYVPNDAAIQALKTSTTDDFTVSATGGNTATQAFNVTLNGVNDTPTLAAPTAPTYTDTAANDTFANTTGTLLGNDRDNDALTYGITGGTPGGTDNINGTVYDVSKGIELRHALREELDRRLCLCAE